MKYDRDKEVYEFGYPFVKNFLATHENGSAWNKMYRPCPALGDHRALGKTYKPDKLNFRKFKGSYL
jgi:hypothetical protein